MLAQLPVGDTAADDGATDYDAATFEEVRRLPTRRPSGKYNALKGSPFIGSGEPRLTAVLGYPRPWPYGCIMPVSGMAERLNGQIGSEVLSITI